MRTSQALLTVFSDEVGISTSRLAVLRFLAIAHPDGLGVMRIARELGVNAAAVTRAVHELVARRLVDTRADPVDARRRTVRLTVDGVRTFRHLHDRTLALERLLASELSDRDLATTMRVLARLRAAVDAVARGSTAIRRGRSGRTRPHTME